MTEDELDLLADKIADRIDRRNQTRLNKRRPLIRVKIVSPSAKTVYDLAEKATAAPAIGVGNHGIKWSFE